MAGSGTQYQWPLTTAARSVSSLAGNQSAELIGEVDLDIVEEVELKVPIADLSPGEDRAET